jgi:hypothetical protein
MPAGQSFLIDKGMVSDKISKIEFEGKQFYGVKIRNQLLHSVHPLWSCDINLKLDGRMIPKEEVYFVIRNQWINLEYLHTIKDIYWYIIENVNLNIKNNFVLSRGLHKIECEFVSSLLDMTIGIDENKIWSFKRQTVVQEAVYSY